MNGRFELTPRQLHPEWPLEIHLEQSATTSSCTVRDAPTALFSAFRGHRKHHDRSETAHGTYSLIASVLMPAQTVRGPTRPL